MMNRDWVLMSAAMLLLVLLCGGLTWAALVAYTRVAYASLGMPSPL